MRNRLWIILSLVTLTLISCAPLFAALGYVPQADLDKANESVRDLTAKLETANTDIKDLEGKLADSTELIEKGQTEIKGLKNQLRQAELSVEEVKSLQCPQSWDMVWNKAIVYYPLEDYPQVPEYMMYYLAITQWSEDPNWVLDNTQPFSVLVFDRDEPVSMAFDTVNDCYILNPDVYPNVSG